MSIGEKKATQSKKRMVRALLRLMRQYPYREITITQITQEAQLSRRTFYRLFSDKDDILAVLFEGLFRVYFTQVKQRQLHHYWDIVQLFFDFWQQRKDLLLLLRQNGLLGQVLAQSYRYAMQVFAFVRCGEVATPPPVPYMLAYSVGGMHAMLLAWVDGGMVVPSNTLVSQLKAGFLSPAL